MDDDVDNRITHIPRLNSCRAACTPNAFNIWRTESGFSLPPIKSAKR